jgi:predicted ATPase
MIYNLPTRLTHFVGRAAKVSPGFSLTPEDARPVAHICRRLDGPPLSIELTRARVNVRTA